MEWFEGDVGAAISSAKSKQSIFCVFIIGEDEVSKNLLEILKQQNVGEEYKELVCIKIDEGSTTFTQFSQLYPVLLVPSVFYVDSSTGLDIEVTVTVSDEKCVLAGLQRAREKFEQIKVDGPAPLPTPGIQEEEAGPADMESRLSRARSMLDENVGTVGQVTSHDTPTNIQDRVERARRMMQQRLEAKEREEEEKEKQKELERRDLGKNLLEMQRKKDQDLLKEQARERRREKEETRLAKEKVQAQIEQDRADRAARFTSEKKVEDEKRKEKEKKALAEKAAEADRAAASRSAISRIQFRLPDGGSQTHQFPSDSPLGDVYAYVSSDLGTGFSKFSLSTTFPRRELDLESKDTSLKDLQLAPTATILVLPQGSGGALSTSDGSLMSLMMLLFTPFTFLFSLLSRFINPQPSSAAQQDNTNNQRKEGGNRGPRAGNIGRLRQSENDDDNNTYNGNSTQQM